MSFWDEHEAAEAALAPPKDPDAGMTPAECLECGHVGLDVYFGSCAACFQRWEEGR